MAHVQFSEGGCCTFLSIEASTQSSDLVAYDLPNSITWNFPFLPLTFHVLVQEQPAAQEAGNGTEAVPVEADMEIGDAKEDAGGDAGQHRRKFRKRHGSPEGSPDGHRGRDGKKSHKHKKAKKEKKSRAEEELLALREKAVLSFQGSLEKEED